jgi:hypothetical protein
LVIFSKTGHIPLVTARTPRPARKARPKRAARTSAVPPASESGPRGVARRERRRSQSREEILEATRRVILRDGMNVTLDAVAEEVGLTKAALYYHFPTKEDILESLLRDVATSLDELIVWARSGPSTHERRL